MSDGEAQRRIVDDYAGHKLYDESGEKIGKVEYTVLDAEGRPEYLAVKTGLFGTGTTLIPESITRLGERDKEFEVQASERAVKDAPTFSDENDLTSDFERSVADHFGLRDESRDSGGATAPSTDSSSEHRDRERDERDERDARDERDRDSGRDSGRSDIRDDERRDDERRDVRDDGSTAGAAASGAAVSGAASGRSGDEHRDESRDFQDSERGGRRDDVRGEDRRDERLDERRDERRDDDRSGSGLRDERGASSSTGSTESRPGGERETIRVTLKREKAYAERVRGEDGAEEVRVRKEMVEEEETVEVEDRLR